MKNFRNTILTVLLLAMSSTVAEAKIWLPQLFQSGMVIQRQQTVPVWGKADPQESVKVTFRGKIYTTVADGDGHWRVDLPKQKPGGPFTMTINEVTLDDVLVGDVWICSGQSNVDIHMERVYPQYPQLIDTYSNDKIRLFRVFTRPETAPQEDVAKTAWKPLNKQNAWNFSALGYFLGKRMWEDNGVPQGVIQCSQGGTPIESWMSLDSLPDQKKRFMLYTDAEYNAIQSKANNVAGDVWNRVLNETDPGYGQYERPDYDDSAWKVCNQYDQSWAKTPQGRSVIGSIWLRQHVNVDAAHAGKSATLFLGTLHDMDYTYVNGKQVGVTYYQYPPRRYRIPEGLLKEGDNVITVRVINKYGTAHFYTDKPHEIVFDDATASGVGERIQLALDWKTQLGSIMPEGPLGGKTDLQNQSSVLYNGMLSPLAPYAVQGFVWYQGESNTGNPAGYDDKLRKMMGNWRTLWEQQKPFVIVQLANHMAPSAQPQNSSWARLRECQRTVAMEDPRAELAVAIDLGEAADIHPLRKQDVADRVALAMHNLVFGKKNLLSPQPLSVAIDDANVTVTMDQPLEEGAINEVELLLSDGRYHNVTARAEGSKLIIPLQFLSNNGDAHAATMPKEGLSVAKNTPGDGKKIVRYAWKDNPDKANLRGKNGLPASPFEM